MYLYVYVLRECVCVVFVCVCVLSVCVRVYVCVHVPQGYNHCCIHCYQVLSVHVHVTFTPLAYFAPYMCAVVAYSPYSHCSYKNVYNDHLCHNI